MRGSNCACALVLALAAVAVVAAAAAVDIPSDVTVADGVLIGVDTPHGRGVMAAKDLDPGTVVLTVPEAHVLHPEQSTLQRLTAADGPCNPKAGVDLAWVALVVRLATETASPSRLTPAYIASLPQMRDMGLASMWDHTARQHLQGTWFDHAIGMGMHQRTMSWHCAKHAGFSLSPVEYDLADARLHSRAFKDANTDAWVLVPWMDMFNYHPSTSKHLCVPAFVDGVGYQVQCPHGAQAGEELFLDYASKSNTELLSNYGFTVDGNPHVRAHVQLQQYMQPLGRRAQRIAHALKLQSVWLSDPITMIPKPLLYLARLAVTPESDLQDADQITQGTTAALEDAAKNWLHDLASDVVDARQHLLLELPANAVHQKAIIGDELRLASQLMALCRSAEQK